MVEAMKGFSRWEKFGSRKRDVEEERSDWKEGNKGYRAGRNMFKI